MKSLSVSFLRKILYDIYWFLWWKLLYVIWVSSRLIRGQTCCGYELVIVNIFLLFTWGEEYFLSLDLLLYSMNIFRLCIRKLIVSWCRGKALCASWLNAVFRDVNQRFSTRNLVMLKIVSMFNKVLLCHMRNISGSALKCLWLLS